MGCRFSFVTRQAFVRADYIAEVIVPDAYGISAQDREARIEASKRKI